MKGTKRWQARGRDKIGDERENLYSCLVERRYILRDSLRIISRSSHSLKEKLVFVRRGTVKTPEARLYRVRSRLALWSLSALCAQELIPYRSFPYTSFLPAVQVRGTAGPKNIAEGSHFIHANTENCFSFFFICWSVRIASFEKKPTKSFSLKELIFWSKLALLET